jgi:hypothetical protein
LLHVRRKVAQVVNDCLRRRSATARPAGAVGDYQELTACKIKCSRSVIPDSTR